MRESERRVCGRAKYIVVLALFTGCATAPFSGRSESSAATIAAAEQVGAARVPRASLHLQLAQEQANQAKTLIRDGGKDARARAERLLMRSQADADLALALAREEADHTAAVQALDNIYSLLNGE